MKIDSIVGVIAGTLCAVSFLPQVIQVVRTKHTKDLSLATFLVLSLGIFLWLIYGILIEQLPVILANGAILPLAVLILIMKIKYK
ncbi:MAG: SemiSWEET transporter [Candidatus Omnitrophota bacterium]|nr:SemiSWEET transporter [Candidatus Omnitrophota bacterium]